MGSPGSQQQLRAGLLPSADSAHRIAASPSAHGRPRPSIRCALLGHSDLPDDDTLQGVFASSAPTAADSSSASFNALQHAAMSNSAAVMRRHSSAHSSAATQAGSAPPAPAPASTPIEGPSGSAGQLGGLGTSLPRSPAASSYNNLARVAIEQGSQTRVTPGQGWGSSLVPATQTHPGYASQPQGSRAGAPCASTGGHAASYGFEGCAEGAAADASGRHDDLVQQQLVMVQNLESSTYNVVSGDISTGPGSDGLRGSRPQSNQSSRTPSRSQTGSSPQMMLHQPAPASLSGPPSASLRLPELMPALQGSAAGRSVHVGSEDGAEVRSCASAAQQHMVLATQDSQARPSGFSFAAAADHPTPAGFGPHDPGTGHWPATAADGYVQSAPGGGGADADGSADRPQGADADADGSAAGVEGMVMRYNEITLMPLMPPPGMQMGGMEPLVLVLQHDTTERAIAEQR